MAKLEIELNEATIKRLEQMAQARQQTVSEVIEGLVDQKDEVDDQISVIGLFADDPDLIDQIIEDAMLAREWRQFGQIN